MSDRDALKARAEELKLDFAANIKTEKLEELVAEAEAARAATGQDAANIGEDIPAEGDQAAPTEEETSQPGDDKANPFEAALTATAAEASEISAEVVSWNPLPYSGLDPEIERVEVLRVQGPNKGFRRAGRAFGPIPVNIPLDELSEEELQALETEPRLMTKRIAMVPE